MSGADLARAAEALAGSSFRLHGRDPATGLDCVGVLAAALAQIGRPTALPTGYPLHMRRIDRLDEHVRACGFVAANGAIRSGDVLMLKPAPLQLHFAIALDQSRIVHAHIGLRRVVVASREQAWPCIARWRLAETN